MNKLLGLCAASLIGLLSAQSAVAEEITASVWFPDTHPLTRDGYLALAEELKERSNGELTMKVYTGTALLPPVAHLSGLTDGLVQMTYHAGTYTPSDLPEDNVAAVLAIGLDDPMVTMMTVADFYMNDPAIKAMFDRHSIVFLGAYASPVYEMMCNREITTLEQVRGAKMRMPSPIHTAWANSVGAASINVPSSDMYSGLEKGQLDCAVNALNDLKSRSLWDVAKHATRLSFGPYFAGWQYAIDQDTWIGLSEPHRRLMLDAISDNSVDLMIAYQATVDEALAEAQSNGVTVSEPSAELQASLDTFVKENSLRIASETGAQLGAQDPEGIVSRFGETYTKWEKLLADTPREDVEALKNIFRTELYNKIDAASYGQK